VYQFLLAIILSLGISTYWLWNENATLTQNNAKLESAVQLQEDAISSLQNDFTLQTGKLNKRKKK
jgi:hypothetical protein